MFKKLVSLAFLAVSGVATSAQAQESGFYVGASVGEATDEISDVGFKDSDTAFKVFGGYAFNKYFGVELAYIDAGTFEDDLGPINVQLDASGVIASLVGSLPLGENISLFGKLGVAFSETDQTLRQGSFRASESESSEDLAYSAGGAVHLGKFTLRAEYEVVDVSDADFNAVFVSALFKF
jgi:OmpA-OmpF porin, OOP family